MPIPRELNLLPPSRRRHLARQLVINALARLATSILWAFIIMAMAGVVTGAILQVWVALSSTTTTALLAERVAHYQAFRTAVAKKNQDLNFMAEVSTKRILWSAYLADLHSTMPPGSRIQALSADLSPAPRLTFSGQAVSRSALVVLEDRLKKLPWVKMVEAPNSNLLQRSNPGFSFDVFLAGDDKPKGK